MAMFFIVRIVILQSIAVFSKRALPFLAKITWLISTNVSLQLLVRHFSSMEKRHSTWHGEIFWLGLSHNSPTNYLFLCLEKLSSSQCPLFVMGRSSSLHYLQCWMEMEKSLQNHKIPVPPLPHPHQIPTKLCLWVLKPKYLQV
jgi:hypothetical protein